MKTVIVLDSPVINLFIIECVSMYSVYSHNELITEHSGIPTMCHSYWGGEIKIIAHCEPSEINVLVLTDKWRSIKDPAVSYTMELLP